MGPKNILSLSLSFHTRKFSFAWTDSPRVAPKRCVMEGVESIVVGDHDVSVAFQKEGEHVVTLLRDGVVERGVALGILKPRKGKGKIQKWEKAVSQILESSFFIKNLLN